MAKKIITRWKGPAHVVWTMNQLATTAKYRGYTFDEVQPCIVETHKDGKVTVNVNHKNFPRYKDLEGVGTEVKKLLARVGIVATENCKCNKRASVMNANGIRWCEDHIDQIVGWLREEAEARKLPFMDVVGRALVKMAIRRAKKANKE